MENKEAIIENLEALLAAVEAQPERLFNLSTFRQESDCGTLFCVAGLACTMPRFKELGMAWEQTKYGLGDPVVNGLSVWHGGGDELFGWNSMDELFQYSGGGTLDEGFFNESEDEYLTDKELAVARLKDRITTYKGE